MRRTVLLLATISVALILLMSPVRAQETTGEQTTILAEETTMVAKEAEELTSEAAAQATDNVAQTEDGESEDDPSAQAQAEASDQALRFSPGVQTIGTQRARQVGGPLVGTPVDTRSNDEDREVDVILIPRQDCDVVAGRTVSFVLEDEDGTQADFIEDETPDGDPENGNVEVEKSNRGFRVTSSVTDSINIIPLNERGGADDVLDTGGLKIVASTGITCEGGGSGGEEGDDDGDEGAGGGTGGTGGLDDCNTLAILEGDDRETENFEFPDGAGRLRVVYSTLSSGGSIKIDVGDMSRASVISETITGAESGIISADVTVPGRLFVSVDPSDQTYKVTFEAVGGDDECTKPGEQGDVLTDAEDDDDIVNVPDDDLPDTGGVPISVLAGCVALLLVATALMGTVLRRGQ